MRQRAELRSHLASLLHEQLQEYRAKLVRTAQEHLPRIEELVAALRSLDSAHGRDRQLEEEA